MKRPGVDVLARRAAMRAGGPGSARWAWYQSVTPCKRCGCAEPRRLAFDATCLECERARWTLEGVMR